MIMSGGSITKSLVACVPPPWVRLADRGDINSQDKSSFEELSLRFLRERKIPTIKRGRRTINSSP